nr:NADH dehydrogenase subunit 5 [Siphluriscus sp. l JZ-2022]
MLWSLSICVISFVFLFGLSLTCFTLGTFCLLSDSVTLIEWEVVSLHSTNILMVLLFDWMSLLFMSFVLLISSLVIYYSKEYMGGDVNMNRFILLVLMFVCSMMLLIMSPNLVSILLGWDGLGLVSYCLVIYYQNVKSYNAGMLTALSNRVGDVMLLLAIAWMLNFGSFNFIHYLEVMKISTSMQVVSGLVLVAAMTKSAQIPFSAWLPAAMAAPTPVSALVHSSTLVTAGVYLMIRFSPSIEGTQLSSYLLLISGLTMFMAGLGANFEFDLKKIIALSTLSQLGLMMSILALGFPYLAFFHLLTHALFKALLFMCAGAIIHNMKDSQDIRNMGSLVKEMPLTSACLNVANLALCGMPFLAGFYSKDLILEMVSMTNTNSFSFFLFFFSTGLTMCYSLRLVYYSLTGPFNSSSCHPLNDEGHTMLRGMMGLLLMAVIGGSLLSWLIFPTPNMICLPFILKLLALLVSILGGWLGYLMSFHMIGSKIHSLEMVNFTSFVGSMWYMPILSTHSLISGLYLGSMITKSADQGWSEELGGQKLYLVLGSSGAVNQWLQINNLKTYLMTFTFWILILSLFMIL